MLRRVHASVQMNERRKKFGNGERPDQLLGPPVPSPFTDVLYSAERGVAGAGFLFAGERRDQGFRWAQFRFPGGGKVELVTPASSGGFVERFLERRGEGVHHVTLKVPDIERAIAHLGDRGVPLFNVSTDRP